MHWQIKGDIIHKRVLFSNKKEWDIDICHKMDKLWKHYAKWKKPMKNLRFIWLQLYQKSKVGKPIETKSRLVVA